MEGRPVVALEVPSGGEISVDEGRILRVPGPDGAPVELDRDVLPEVALAPAGDRLVYPRRRPDTELVITPVPASGPPRVLLSNHCSQDRPVFSPDGARVAFVSGCTGIASVWVIDLDDTGLGARPGPDGLPAPVQVTNRGLEQVPRVPGQPPEGWIPAPEGRSLAWSSDGATLSWTARGRRFTVAAP